MTNRSVHLHRVLRAKPERVYRAFLDPEALVEPEIPDTPLSAMPRRSGDSSNALSSSSTSFNYSW